MAMLLGVHRPLVLQRCREAQVVEVLFWAEEEEEEDISVVTVVLGQIILEALGAVPVQVDCREPGR
jgi:hypothetical protein